MTRSEAAATPCDCALRVDNRRLWADIAAGRVPPPPWDGAVAEQDPPDDLACMHPGSRCACDQAADYYYRNEVTNG